MKWYKKKDGTEVYKQGRYKVLEIFRRPHKAYCCVVFHRGSYVAMEGYHSTSFPKKYFAVRWGMAKLKEYDGNL